MDLNILFKGKIISKSRYLDGILKYKGLMFSRKLKKGESVVLFGSNLSVHMLFVFFPLDIIFLDADKKVVDIRRGFPFISFIRPKEEANYAIEMNSGENILSIGDKVEFIL